MRHLNSCKLKITTVRLSTQNRGFGVGKPRHLFKLKKDKKQVLVSSHQTPFCTSRSHSSTQTSTLDSAIACICQQKFRDELSKIIPKLTPENIFTLRNCSHVFHIALNCIITCHFCSKDFIRMHLRPKNTDKENQIDRMVQVYVSEQSKISEVYKQELHHTVKLPALDSTSLDEVFSPNTTEYQLRIQHDES